MRSPLLNVFGVGRLDLGSEPFCVVLGSARCSSMSVVGWSTTASSSRHSARASRRVSGVSWGAHCFRNDLNVRSGAIFDAATATESVSANDTKYPVTT
ncbi:hypothetical protein [Yimella sp. NH-Cas1]|uniref:hypothetical protein n=1 Tax=Yimella sp. NH-Cas1 TaxID=2917726 RepID=UPI001EFA660D|nr:hypothetical protein [Yimella sp. NH-Cas1]MCG8656284.1 hypothetical protein [Yimella sp. NH-Cas1]